ncbi:MAG: TRAP transporter large permease [Pirellulales bacterium]|nr:TRAP transporter large permease [Pirellulales bacterium]
MLLLVGLMLLLLLAGVPVAFAIGIAAAVFLLSGSSDVPPVVLAQMTLSGADSFILLAVPFFIFAGELMNAGGITRRLVAFAEALVGSLRGGLAYVVVLVNMIMAGVSGAAIADAAAVGSVMIPSMVRRGYRPGFAGAVNAAAATIGPVVPPSVGFIIYASLTGQSVGRLFLAGAIPGLLMGLYLMVVCFIVARKDNLPLGRRTSLRVVAAGLKDAFWALAMPVIILGGILGGVVTPTEAGCLAVLYGLFVGTVIYGELRMADLPYLLAKSAKQTAVILFIIATAKTFGWLLTYLDAPGMLVHVFGSISDRPWVFLLVMNTMIIALGCFMEGGSLMIILTPLLLPVLTNYQIDLVHFGVVFQLNIMIGLLTPPIGMLLYVITGVSGVEMNKILPNLWPFLVAIVLVLLLTTYVPVITLFLPNLLMPAASG